MPTSSRYIFQLNNSKIFMISFCQGLFCDSCQEVHPIFNLGPGSRNYQVSELDFEILYKDLGD